MKFSKVLSVLFFLFFSSFAFAQDVGDLFIKMPEDIVPYLNHSMRKEMVEMYRYGVDSNTKNKFDEMSSVDSLSACYARFKLSSIKKLELMVLSFHDSDTIICSVATYSEPVPSSKISFYDKNWKELDTSLFLPEIKSPLDLVEKPDDMSEDKYQELLKYIDPYYIVYTVNPENRLIDINLSVLFDNYDQKKEIISIFRKRTLIWDGKNFN